MSNRPLNRSFVDVLNARLSRRGAIKALTAAGACIWSPGSFAASAGSDPQLSPSRFTFSEIQHGVSETHVVAAGYDAHVLIGWGDAVLAGAPEFNPLHQTAEAQEMQFGYNNDHIGFFPLPLAAGASHHGLLCINHEYPLTIMMFPSPEPSRAKSEVEQAALGCSVVEVTQTGGRWRIVDNSRYARRISTRSTTIEITGPAAGSDRLRTREDPDGRRVLGTVGNCGGGTTPWGTCLVAEENFNLYFGGKIDPAHREARNYARYEIFKKHTRAHWPRYFDRWDIARQNNEANRFGWIVEVDPYDPASTPAKRTGLGRLFHEGASVSLNRDGRIVIYMADDKPFEYIYRFVSRNQYNPLQRRENFGLLDDGTLSVARFDEDGSLSWRPLVFGEAGLDPRNGFYNAADVMIEARVAADLAGATAMDRPEGIAVSPTTGNVFVMLTGNKKRKPAQVDQVNRRAANLWGQIVELVPPDGDHTADIFGWEVLVQCGPPEQAHAGATWNTKTSAHGWFAAPDNCAFDRGGGLWVCTDQSRQWYKKSGTADGLWAVETQGERRGTGKMFFRVPVGAELTGPAFTPDDQTLFLSVQHPAADGTEHYAPFGRFSSFTDPATRWPDFDPHMPPRPAVVAVTRSGGGRIGS